MKKFKDKKYKSSNPEETVVTRAPLPKGEEIIGIIEERHGGNKMKVACLDQKERVCRVPGRLKRKLWIRPGNIVLVEPWEFEGDIKGDLIHTYKPAEIQWLERKGFLKGIQEEF